jgi:hypothetical protein
MESRLGHDLDNVRIHDDARAAASAQSIDALAYTSGNHIVFGAGQYQPRSDQGARLLAHELAHTIQQNGSRIMRQAAQNPCRQARCSPAQNTTALADFARAIRYVNAALQALNAAPLATDTIRALDWFFNSHEPDTVNEVKRRLGCIGACLADTQTNSRYGCDLDDTTSLAYVRVPPTAVCSHFQTDVCLTNEHFGTDDRERAETVVHECAHRVGMSLGAPTSVEDMYRFTARFMNLNTSDALQNADSFAMFAGAVTEGVRLSVAPLFSMTGGVAGVPGDPATWRYRIYGGAEFQHPVLHLFNPTIGLAATFIGNSADRTPTEPSSSPSILLSLIGGVRLTNPRPGGAGGPYVDLSGGPSVSFIGGPKIGAEAGVAVGYRWRWLDVSVGAGYDYDPNRDAGSRHIASGNLSVGIIPNF